MGRGGREEEGERGRERTLSLSPCNDCPDSETCPHQDFKRFLATPTQPTSTISRRNEEMLKLLSAVSWLVEGGGGRERDASFQIEVKCTIIL